MFGLPVERMLHSNDSVELAYLDAARREAFNVLDTLMTVMARKIINEYADAQERAKASGKG